MRGDRRGGRGAVPSVNRSGSRQVTCLPVSQRPVAARLSSEDLESILAVTRSLAAPFDLRTMLQEVAASARSVLRAERASIWLHDVRAGELYVEVASDLPPVRVPLGVGLVGASARDRALINVPDCYADPRFNPEIDRKSGFRTRCLLTLPLVDHRDELVGVMQVLNRRDGVFDAADESLAEALAAQCAVALSRTRMMEALVAAEVLRKEVELAAVVQKSSLPGALPAVAGYEMHAEFLPASLTGGDTYDLALLPQGLLVVLGDATGHGIGPALSVTQMQAMLRMALRLGAGLETAFRNVNDALAQTLTDGRFVTAFIGLLDPQQHVVRFLSGGQGPILHFQATAGACAGYKATSFPMGAMPIVKLRPAVELTLAPGDWLVLMSDGVYEAASPSGEQFGRARVEALVSEHRDRCPRELAQSVLDAVRLHVAAQEQGDDITIVLLKRAAG
jgi:phosphoserine phosphatase RsbU/P